ncbi:hypothetical protein JNUCC31_06235 [Paenibacillus sp. JNUCC31]|uniref:hypothetical protein n=1 Tax=Paenibacillus sp. JNUCC-31 TaxID=2777983 RepID=UPI00177FCA38|nr:hypothetical protein [Paenibacillus sp. JNUCC-31]QOS80502.1 hypothetical protein JNUCC31_06235 [Paenibacillus sp. JNUCC-31]
MSMKELYLAEFNQCSWDSFVLLFEEAYLNVDSTWAECAEQRGIPADISKVLLCEMGEYALRWMDMKVPALGDESPASYLGNKEDMNALRAAIMRMPR